MGDSSKLHSLALEVIINAHFEVSDAMLESMLSWIELQLSLLSLLKFLDENIDLFFIKLFAVKSLIHFGNLSSLLLDFIFNR